MFADEPHYSRGLTCGWSRRAETALSIARRVRAMARELVEIDPRLDALWPQFAMRAIRPTDPGPVLELSDEELGDLIDRRARFDTPAFPAPVDPWGYLLALGGTPTSALREYRALVKAGRLQDAPLYNEVQLDIDQDHAIWRDLSTAKAVLGVLVRNWAAEWGYAAGRPGGGACGDTFGRPLMIWSATKGTPAPRTFLDIGPPSEVRDYLGGELQVWP